MFNTTTIIGMVVVFIETRIETVGTDYRSEQSKGVSRRALLLGRMTVKE